MLKLHTDSFHAWLSSRIRNASTGMIFDPETGESVDIATAPSRVFLEHTRRRAEYHKKEYKEQIHNLARDQAKADPDDPFIYARTKTHLEHGICALDDYGIEFRRVTVDLMDFNGEVVGRKTADVPMKMKRA